MAETRPRCKKHVYSGARHDMGGHQCGNYAQPGSDFCHLHSASAKVMEEDAVQEATAEPTLTSSTRRTYFASLGWKPGEGPVVRPPYRSGVGFITRALATATDDGPPRVKVSGLMRKKDGTPGQQGWDATFRAEDVLGPDWTNALLDALADEREKEARHG